MLRYPKNEIYLTKFCLLLPPRCWSKYLPMNKYCAHEEYEQEKERKKWFLSTSWTKDTSLLFLAYYSILKTEYNLNLATCELVSPLNEMKWKQPLKKKRYSFIRNISLKSFSYNCFSNLLLQFLQTSLFYFPISLFDTC